jgi:hypothetical protein
LFHQRGHRSYLPWESDGSFGYDSRGPLVCRGMKDGYSTAIDLDTTDFQHIIDYFNTNRFKPDSADPMEFVQKLHEEIATWVPKHERKPLTLNELKEARRERAGATEGLQVHTQSVGRNGPDEIVFM